MGVLNSIRAAKARYAFLIVGIVLILLTGIFLLGYIDATLALQNSAQERYQHEQRVWQNLLIGSGLLLLALPSLYYYGYKPRHRKRQ